jgi:hypothetical protein
MSPRLTTGIAAAALVAGVIAGVSFSGGFYSVRGVGGGSYATWVVNRFTGTAYLCTVNGCRVPAPPAPPPDWVPYKPDK